MAPHKHAHHIVSATNSLVGAMQGLLQTLGSPPIGGPVLPDGLATPKQRGPGKGNPKFKRKLKAH